MGVAVEAKQLGLESVAVAQLAVRDSRNRQNETCIVRNADDAAIAITASETDKR